MGNLRDPWNEASLEKGHWFDSDLCILEPINSTQMAVFEQLKVTGLLCSRFSATVKKGRRFFALAGKDVELPNTKGGKKNAASKRQQAARPVASAPDGGSPVEGEMAEELLAVPGSSGVDVGASGSTPSVPAGSSAAAAGSAAAEPVAAGPAVVSPVVEPAVVQTSAPAMEQVVAVEPIRVELSVPAVEAAAAAPAAEAATAVRLVSEALSGLALELAAVEESTAGVLAGEPAAVEPTAATAAVSAAAPTAAEGRRPVLANGPVAASKECWVINPGIGPKVIVRRISSGPAAAAAEAAAPGKRQAGESLPELGSFPAARRAAAETRASPVATTSRPAVPAAAAPGKRKAKAGVAGGSQKRKKSSPVKIKDL